MAADRRRRRGGARREARGGAGRRPALARRRLAWALRHRARRRRRGAAPQRRRSVGPRPCGFSGWHGRRGRCCSRRRSCCGGGRRSVFASKPGARSGLTSPPFSTPRRAIRSCVEAIRARERRLIGVLELFKVGIGPSSSHTVGPMKAAAAFAEGLALSGAIERVEAVVVTLYGSLAFTGKGHATDKAVILGLSGERPDTIDPDRAEALVADVAARKSIVLCGRRAVRFDPADRHPFRLCDGAQAPSQHARLLRARRSRANRERGGVAVGRRRVRRSRGRRAGGGRRGRRLSSSVSQRRRAARARRRERAGDRRAGARQRGGDAPGAPRSTPISTR